MYVYVYILRAKPPAEVLAFGAYMFESLQSFYNSLIKAYSMFSMSNLQLICQNCRISAIIIWYRYIFDIHCLLYSIAYITLFIFLTETLPF